MYPHPSSHSYSIDRINSFGHYELGNVRWLDESGQNRNQRKDYSTHGKSDSPSKTKIVKNSPVRLVIPRYKSPEKVRAMVRAATIGSTDTADSDSQQHTVRRCMNTRSSRMPSYIVHRPHTHTQATQHSALPSLLCLLRNLKTNFKKFKKLKKQTHRARGSSELAAQTTHITRIVQKNIHRIFIFEFTDRS